MGGDIPSRRRPTGVRLGEWDLTTEVDCEISSNNRRECADRHVDVAIEEIVVHPNFNGRNSAHLHDIALIRLNRTVAFTDFISPVCLPIQPEMRTKTFDDLKLDTTGFGATENNTHSSNLKLKAVLQAWNLEMCRQKYDTKRIHLQETQMCAGGQRGVDTCNGDSGGPLVARENIDKRDVYVLAGIVSFGRNECGTEGWPGVYTRVGAYADWILNALKA